MCPAVIYIFKQGHFDPSFLEERNYEEKNSFRSDCFRYNRTFGGILRLPRQQQPLPRLQQLLPQPPLRRERFSVSRYGTKNGRASSISTTQAQSLTRAETQKTLPMMFTTTRLPVFRQALRSSGNSIRPMISLNRSTLTRLSRTTQALPLIRRSISSSAKLTPLSSM